MRIRQHVNPLKSDFLAIAVKPVVVPAGVAVEVELGSGEAWFLMERAAAEPDRRYFGVEIRRDLVVAANAECERRGLGQVGSVFANMSLDLPRLFAPASVSRFFLNFPDPWWKTRQHKRRVIGEALARELHGLLAPGGEVFVATDVFDIALDAMAVFDAEAPRRWDNMAGSPWSFLRASPFAARSRREQQCVADGTRIWRLGFRARTEIR
jgi:tRNA (guanine-N7-)-methyltransferase